MRLFLGQVKFWDAPSLFFFNSSETFIYFAAYAGVFLSLLTVTGISEQFGSVFSFAVWFLLWALYLSFVNAGQTFYGFGWETLLLESGFLAMFLGAAKSAPPVIIIWLYRWLLFRVMFGAGLIKMRGDECWRNLTCMDYHYETQPLPNPLSWYFHHLPHFWHKTEVLANHFIELIVPFLFFIPGPVGMIAGLITLLFHLVLIVSGNLSWLNYITIAITFSCFSGPLLAFGVPEIEPMNPARAVLIGALTVLIVYLSIEPAMNLFSRRQKMNASFDPLHIVNTYGAFGSITRVRNEVILEGTDDPAGISGWKEYEFKGKPGDPMRVPPQVSPYHYKLDWQLWFAAMSDYRYHPWILNLVQKFLENDRPVLSLIKTNPFGDKPPQYVRALLYEYHFTTPEEKKKTGAWWKRELRGNYLPPLSLRDANFQDALKRIGFK